MKSSVPYGISKNIFFPRTESNILFFKWQQKTSESSSQFDYDYHDERAYLAYLLKQSVWKYSSQSLIYKRLNAEASKSSDKVNEFVRDNHTYKCSTRAYFIVKVYQYITGESFHEAVHRQELFNLVLIGEFCITLMYLENHYLDRKFGVVDEESRKRNRKERNQLAREFYHFISDNYEGLERRKILWYVKRLFRNYYKGCKLDVDNLRYERFRSNVPDSCKIDKDTDEFVDIDEFLKLFTSSIREKYGKIEHEHYVRLYLTRSFLINGVFFQVFVELLLTFLVSNGCDYLPLFKFARVFGLVQQLVNDNCDYLPVSYRFSTPCKFPEDTFSDARRRLVTLPIICYLSHEYEPINGLVDHYSGEKDFSTHIKTVKSQRNILNQLIHRGALSHSMSIAARIAQKGTYLLPIDNPFTVELNRMLNVASENKYYREYFIIKKKLAKEKAGKCETQNQLALFK